MIINVDISIDSLSTQGKNFKWVKPDACPACTSHLWGHGHVFSNNLFLKRYRCNNCLIVITLKPFGFWKNYRTSIKNIYLDLRHRLVTFHWRSNEKRQRRNDWLKKFISFIKMEGFDHPNKIIAGLDLFYSKSIPFLS